MKNKSIAVVILAAGMGKRMNNPNLPKVLAEIDSKPLIYYVLKQVENLSPERTLLVVGHKKEMIIEYVEKSDFKHIDFAFQSEQLGTGHAVEQTRSMLSDFDGDILILAGDVPLLKSESLLNFINIHFDSNADVSVLSTTAPNPHGYGRVVRDNNGNFIKITEHKDADEEILKIDEINSGIYIINSKDLFESLHKIKNDNVQGEYYLTDIIEILKKDNKNVLALNAAPFEELQGINTFEELAKATEIKLKMKRKNILVD